MTGILLFIIAALAAEAPQFQLDTVGGQPATGALVELSAQHVVLKTADGNRDIKLADVRRLSRQENSENGTTPPAKQPAAPSGWKRSTAAAFRQPAMM